MGDRLGDLVSIAEEPEVDHSQVGEVRILHTWAEADTVAGQAGCNSHCLFERDRLVPLEEEKELWLRQLMVVRRY